MLTSPVFESFKTEGQKSYPQNVIRETCIRDKVMVPSPLHHDIIIGGYRGLLYLMRASGLQVRAAIYQALLSQFSLSKELSI